MYRFTKANSHKGSGDNKDRAGVLFPVSIVPATEVLGSGFTTTTNEAFFVLGDMPNGTRKLLNTCSSKYELVGLGEIIPKFEAMIHGYKYSTKYKSYDDRNFTITYVFEDQEERTAIVGDILAPTVSFFFSYASDHQMEMALGLKRYVCANGMAITESGGRMAKRYTKSIRLGFIDDMLETITEFLKDFKHLLRRFKVLEERQLRPDEIEIVSDMVVVNEILPKTTIQDAIRRAEHELEQAQLSTMNAWHLYNGFNFQLNHNDKYIGSKKDSDLLTTDTKLQTLLVNYAEYAN